MRKIYVLAMALFAVCAVSFSAAPSALAVSKFLVGGNEIGGSGISGSLTMEFSFEDMNVIGKPNILCSKIYDVTKGPGGIGGTITDMLTLAGTLLEDAPTKADLVECEAHSTCSNPTDFVVTGLPWTTGVGLSGAVFVELFSKSGGGGEPGFMIDCNTIIGLIEDTCTGQFSAILTNEAEGVLAEFSETNESITTPLNCTQGGAKQGLLAGSGVILNLSVGGTLSISE